MIHSLQKQDELQELASFLSILSTSTCLLPHSVEIARQPWQTIPIILTPDECKAGVVANKEYLPVVRDNYASVHEYGRTYFLLLRADCHGDLASLIHQLREPDSPSRKRDRDRNAVVCDAQVTGFSNQGTKRSLVYHFAVQTRPLPPEDQSRDTPLFKAGNLLCLSVGGRFEDDVIWGTINHISSYVHSEQTKQGLVKSVRKTMNVSVQCFFHAPSVSRCVGGAVYREQHTI